MSDKEKALDALQVILNLSACHNMSKVNNEVIARSEIIKKALNKLPEKSIEGERISCFYIPGRSVAIEDAQTQFNSCDAVCASCGSCQL